MAGGSATLIAIDTNLFVYAHRSGTPQHEPARQAITSAHQRVGGWGVPAPVLAEFWRVVTGSAAGERPASPAQAAEFLSDLRMAGAQVLLPLPGFGVELTNAASRLGIRGVRVYDLQIALTALQHGARELWTHDRAFLPFPGLRLRDPLRR